MNFAGFDFVARSRLSRARGRKLVGGLMRGGCRCSGATRGGRQQRWGDWIRTFCDMTPQAVQAPAATAGVRYVPGHRPLERLNLPTVPDLAGVCCVVPWTGLQAPASLAIDS